MTWCPFGTAWEATEYARNVLGCRWPRIVRVRVQYLTTNTPLSAQYIRCTSNAPTA